MPHDPTRSRPAYADAAAERLIAPAAERNAGPIAAVLADLLAGGGGAVLEVGAGTGQHAVACAAALPHLTWAPSDPDALHLGSIAAWRAAAGAANLRAPRRLDAAGPWPDDLTADLPAPLRAVFCANVIHIAPWSVAEGLARGAAGALPPGGLMILYGPFLEGDATTEGNRAFDAALRARDPRFGVRDAAEVAALFGAEGFGPPRRVQMPAGNLILAFPRL